MQNLQTEIGTQCHRKTRLQKLAVARAQAITPDEEHDSRHNRRHKELSDILVIAVFNQALFNRPALVKNKPVLHEKRDHQYADNNQQKRNQLFLFHCILSPLKAIYLTYH